MNATTLLARVLGLVLLAAALAGPGRPAWAQLAIDPEPDPAFAALQDALEPVIEPLPIVEEIEVEPELINGTPVDPRNFPAVFRMTTGGTCTATLIGPGTILLAAHCVSNGARIAFRAGGTRVAGICEHAPLYAGGLNMGSDLALCLLERRVTGIAYARVSFDLPSLNADVVLSGYGCTFEGGTSDGVLRVGTSAVVNRPPGFAERRGTLYTRSSVAAGGALLCPGDSGGPLFRMPGGIEGPRAVIAVNSATQFDLGVSLFAALGFPSNRAFLEDHAQRHGQSVCGINLTTPCR